MTKILFVCYGNICRSPMAEFVMKELVRKAGKAQEFFIDSAAVSREEIGNGIHRGTLQKLREENVPCDGHRARQMTAQDYQEFDWLIGMDSDNIDRMRRIAGGDPAGKIFRLLDISKRPRDIADPWYTGNFDDTYADVFEGCCALLGRFSMLEKLGN